MKGTIFDIQRFSVHDGPGIRTTVFFKGCNLRCPWCHNPEGVSPLPQLLFHQDQCLNCGLCQKKTLENAERCSTGALEICGRDVDVETLLPMLIRDIDFYEQSGGVTFSGGECLLQPDFLTNILRLCKERGLSTAIDTAGYVPWDHVAQTIPYCDLYLYDIKSMDDAKHKAWTGAGNQLIRDNLIRLDSHETDIWIRIPVIPGFNDTLEDMEDIAKFIHHFSNVKEITLMPYHTIGKNKYSLLGTICQFNPTTCISKVTLTEFQQVFEHYGMACHAI